MKNACLSLAALAVSGLGSGALAQVGPGESVQFLLDPNQTTGIRLLDHTTTPATPTLVGGLPAELKDVNAGTIDPVTGDLWCVSHAGAGYRVYRVSLNGDQVDQAVLVADVDGVGPQLAGYAYDGLQALELDRDGNPFVADSTNLIRIDRQTGAVTLWASGLGLGTINALGIRTDTNTLVTATWESGYFLPPVGISNAELRLFNLSAGPSQGMTVYDPVSAGDWIGPTGMVVDEAGDFWFSTGSGLFRFDAQSLIVYPEGAWTSMWYANAIDLDRETGLFHVAAGFPEFEHAFVVPGVSEQTVFADPACAQLTAPGFCSDVPVPSDLSVNDFRGTTTLYPRVASRSADFVLETAAHGMPGDFALVAIDGLNGQPIAPFVLGGIGVCDGGGFSVRSVPVPAGALDPSLTQVSFSSVTLDPVTFATSVGDPVQLVLTP